MKETMIRALALLMVAPTGGCVSMGPNYDAAAVDRLTPGMTNTEVIGLLGRPSTTTTLADGRQQLMWVHSRGTMLGTATARSLTLMFTPDGRYVEMTSHAETNIR